MTNLNTSEYSSTELNSILGINKVNNNTHSINNQGENQMTANPANPNSNSNKTFRVWFVLMTFVLAGLAAGADVDPGLNFDPTGGTGKLGKGAFRKVGKKTILSDEVKQEIANKAIFDINNLAGVAFAFQLVSPFLASMFPLSIANGINEITGARIGNFRLDFEDAIWTSKDGKFVVPDVKWERWNAWNTVETVEASIPNAPHSSEMNAQSAEVSIPKTNKPSQNRPVPRTNIIKGFSSVDLTNATPQMIKGAFDAEVAEGKYAISGEQEYVRNFTKNVLETTKVIVNFKAKTLTIKSVVGGTEKEPLVFHARNFVVLSFENKEDDKVVGVYDASTMLGVIAGLVNDCRYIKEVNALVKGLISKVFIDRPEQALVNPNSVVYGARNEATDQQNIINFHKVNLVKVEVEKEAQSLRTKFVFNDRSEFNGTELSAVIEYFAALGEPVITDKNNKKYFVYGDGARACGVDLVDGEFVTLNPINLVKGAKVFNRMISYSFKKVEHAFLSIEGELVGGIVNSGLEFALSNGKTVKGAGVAIPQTFISFGHSILNGVMETNKKKDVRFEMEQVKSASDVTVSLYSFDPSFVVDLGKTPQEQLLALRDKITEFVINWAENNDVVKAHQVVRYEGQIVIQNTSEFDYKIDNTGRDYIKVRLGAADHGDTIRSLNVNIRALNETSRSSVKGRNNGLKFTTVQTETVIKLNGVEQDWNAILDPNCIKTSAAILNILANMFPERTFKWEKGVITMDGVAQSQEELKDLLRPSIKEYVIERPIKGLRAYYEQQGIKGFTYRDDYVIEKVEGFFGTPVMEIEVSTADENHGVSNLGVNEQVMLSNLSSHVSEKLSLVAEEKLNTVLIDSEIPIFNLVDNAVSLTELLTVNASPRTKDHMNALTQKKAAIQVVVKLPKENGDSHLWKVTLPFQLLNNDAYSWDEAGNPVNGAIKTMAYGDEGAIITSHSIANEVFNFIYGISRASELSNEELKGLFLRGGLINTWVEDRVTARRANSATKAGRAFHQKVVPSLNCGTKDIVVDVPGEGKQTFSFHVIKVNSTNGMLGNKELDKLVKKGEAVREIKGTIPAKANYRFVLLSRCPLPLFTAVVVEFDDTLDPAVIAVDPLVWIKSNFGDYDGDLGYVTDCGQFGSSSVKALAKFNENYSAFHVSNEGDKVIRGALGYDEEGNKTTVEELLNSWTEINNRVSVSDFAALGYNVYNHYKNSVGTLYRIAEAATQRLALEGRALTNVEVKGLINAWVLYESVGLSGWTVENQEKIAELRKQVKLMLGHPDFTKVGNNSSDLCDLIAGLIIAPFIAVGAVGLSNADKKQAFKNARKQEVTAQSEASVEFDGVILAAACSIEIAKQIQAGKRRVEGNEKAVVAQAISLLTRKQITKNEDKIFRLALKADLSNCRFAKQIETISALRASVKPNK